jgi:acyl-CoA hydrolase/GNAT superfamily N-acetyltransferase
MKETPPRYTIPEAMNFISEMLKREARPDKRPLVYLPGNAGMIPLVENWIHSNPEKLRGTDIFQVLALGSAEGWKRTVMSDIGIYTPFIGPAVRELVSKGLAKKIGCNLSLLWRLFSEGFQPDVAFAHTSRADSIGRVTLGLNAGIDFSAVEKARFKVAVVNKQMPRWHIGMYTDPKTGKRVQVGCAMKLTDFDMVIEINEPLHEHRMTKRKKEREGDPRVIAGHIIDFLSRDKLPNGDLPHTLQLGIGAIPNALAETLAERDQAVQGIWSELISDGVLDLYKKKLIRKIDGFTLRDHIVLGIVLGSNELYRTMHDNRNFAVVPQKVVNDPTMIRENEWMTSVNTTLKVSLTGEVAAASLDLFPFSGVGGQFDFAYGSLSAVKGLAIIALSSVAELRSGSLESKIVATHSEGAHHTISADLPVIIATEYGIADPRALADRDRVLSVIGIAHPGWRDALLRSARTLPSLQGVGLTPSPRLILLKDGQIAFLRPMTKNDIPAITEFIIKMSAEDRRKRYMATVNIDVLIAPKRLADQYDDKLDFLIHAAFVAEINDEIVGITRAFRTKEEGVYELSFSTRSDLHGRGVGTNLMQILIDWGVASKAKRFQAVTYRTENPRMRAIFDRFGFIAEYDPDDSTVVHYSGTPETLGYILKNSSESDELE